MTKSAKLLKTGLKNILKEASMQNNPYLSGNYAPVQDELETKNLKVIGTIPQDLTGIYMRNGPNPEFSPISYNYPFDGDGMIHAVYLANGEAHYRNRYVETKGLLKERKAGKALYGGISNIMPMDPEWADAEDAQFAMKDGPTIHIIRHAGRYLALSEGAPAYEMNAKLETIGKWNPTNTTPIDVCAHIRRDPVNGDLWFVNYAMAPPYLSLFKLDDRVVEFPRIKDANDTLPHQFIYTPTRTENMNSEQGFNALVKYDVKNQNSKIYEFGQHAQVGEAVFAPVENPNSEDDGYLMLFVYDASSAQSEFFILDAQQLTLLARIQMPRRVPNGFHGSWMPGEWV
jgi:carotenoid cleavage dioxygenase-like enzyme